MKRVWWDYSSDGRQSKAAFGRVVERLLGLGEGRDEVETWKSVGK
jgi:hypothetical protein